MSANSKEFKNPRKFVENLNKSKKLKTSLITKAVFALVTEQLNYDLNKEEKLWLKEYYDEYE